MNTGVCFGCSRAGQPSSVEPTSDLFQTAQTEGIIYYPRGRERPLTAPERIGILSRGLWQTSRFPAQHLDPSSGRPGGNSKTKLHAQKKKAIKYSVLRTHPPPTLSLFGLAVSLLKSPSSSGSALFSSKKTVQDGLYAVYGSKKKVYLFRRMFAP